MVTIDGVGSTTSSTCRRRENRTEEAFSSRNSPRHLPLGVHSLPLVDHVHRSKMQAEFQAWYEHLVCSAEDGEGAATPEPHHHHLGGEANTPTRRPRPPVDAWGTPPSSVGSRRGSSSSLATGSGSAASAGGGGGGGSVAVGGGRDAQGGGAGGGLLPPLTGEWIYDLNVFESTLNTAADDEKKMVGLLTKGN